MSKSDINRGERSSRYPAINLEFAVKVITEARVFGRSITNNHIAGKGVPKGGGFLGKKAALGYYSLISGRGDKLYITDLAESIIYSKGEEEKRSAIQTAFLSPESFNKLYSDTEKNVPIDLGVLGNLIIRQYGISPAGKKSFLSTFVSSGIFADLVEYSDEKKGAIILKEQVSKETEKNDIQVREESIHSQIGFKTDFQSTETQKIELALENGKGYIVLPQEITPKDIKKLIAQIKIFGDEFE